MANYINLELDTTAPSSPTIIIDGDAQYSTDDLVECTIGVADGVTDGYQMMIWGDVDLGENVNIQDTEVSSTWVTYSTSQQVKLLTGDGSKTINLRVRDDVNNESSQASDAIIVDETLPVVTTTAPDKSKISKQTSKNIASFSFTAGSTFDEYKIKVVGNSGASQDTGTLIPTTAGSSNTSGVAGAYPSATGITVSIYGTDLETADSGDGSKIVKVFIKDVAGNWSV